MQPAKRLCGSPATDEVEERRRNIAELRCDSDCDCLSRISAGDLARGKNPCEAYKKDTELADRIMEEYAALCVRKREYEKTFAQHDPPYAADVKDGLKRLLKDCCANIAAAEAAVPAMTHWDKKISMYNVYSSALEPWVREMLAVREFES